MTDIELEKRLAEISNLNEETRKMMAETAKLKREHAWYPAVLIAGFMTAAVAVTKLFL